MANTRRDKTEKRQRKGVSLQAYINPALDKQLRQSAENERRTLTAELELALEYYLAHKKMWPPPEGQEEDS